MKNTTLQFALLSLMLLVNGGLNGKAFGTTSRVVSAGVPTSQVKVDINIFHDVLAKSGRWFADQELGWVWSPYNVGVNWRPYTVGHWVYTDYGWTWDSDEDWGWATYHYGRWYFDASYGWIWVPGNLWGPAWVSWRLGEGFIGWAPLPPEASWDVGAASTKSWFDIDEFIPPRWYCFVAERDINDVNIRDRIIPSANNVTLVQVTKNVTRYDLVNKGVMSDAIDVRQIEKESGTNIKLYKVIEAGSLEALRAQRIKGDEIPIYRPAVAKAALERPPQIP